MMGKSNLVGLVMGLLLLASIGCSKFARPVSSGPDSPANPIAVTVELNKYPKLYEPVEVTVTITARHFDVPGAEVWIEFPSQAIYVSGDLTWNGDLIQRQPAQFAATLAFIEEGTSIVSASIWALPPANSGYAGMGGGGSVFLFVGKDSGSAPQAIDYDNHTPQALPPPGIVRIGYNSRLLRDQSRLLNGSDRPRFIIIDTRERLEQLQQEGLIPKELNYQWRRVAENDFDESLLIAAYDRARPDSASNIRITGNLELEYATRLIKVSTTSVDIPPNVVRASRPTSAVQIAQMHKSNLVYLGEQTFEFSLNQEAIDRDSVFVK